MITGSNYLDFRHVIVDELIGSTGLTLLLGYILITYLCVRERVPLQGIVAFNFLWTALIMTAEYIPGVWLFATVIVLFFVYIVYDKWFRR